MTEQEKINSDVQMKLAIQDAKFNVFMQEMRDRDNQRAKEISELRQKQEADMKEIRMSIDGMGKHVRNISVAAMAGVGTSVIAVVVLVGTVVYSVLTR